MYDIRRARDTDAISIVAFLAKVSQTRMDVVYYNTPEYIQTLVRFGIGTDYSLLALRGEEIVAYLPGMLSGPALPLVYCSMPFFGANGGVIYDAQRIGAIEAHDALLGRLFHELAEMGAATASIYTPFLTQERELYGRVLAPNFTVERETLYTDIDGFNIPKKLSYDIRAALRQGVEVVGKPSEQDFDWFYSTYVASCTLKDIPVKPKQILEQVAKSSGALFLTARFENVNIGGLLVLYFGNTASYYVPCYDEAYKKLQPNSLLIFHAIQQLKALGVRYMNWEPSPGRDSGVFKFKRKWSNGNSRYCIYTYTFSQFEKIREMSVSQVTSTYPYYFVYPFQHPPLGTPAV